MPSHRCRPHDRNLPGRRQCLCLRRRLGQHHQPGLAAMSAADDEKPNAFGWILCPAGLWVSELALGVSRVNAVTVLRASLLHFVEILARCSCSSN